MPKALFVAYGGGHVAMAIPTIQEMWQRGWKTTVLGLTTAGRRLSEAGVPSIGFRELLNPGDHRAREHGLRLANENHTAGTGVSLEESIAYLGLSYADLEDRHGAVQAAQLYADKKRHAFLPLGPLRRLIRRESPDIVVATTSPKAERAAVLVAREMGIPSVVMVDLFGKDWDYLLDPEYGDLSLVFAPIVYDDYLQRGRTRENLVLTGNPAFDRLASPRFAEAGRRWREEQGLSDQRVILWAATTMLREEHVREVLTSLSDLARRKPGYRVVYRPHPSTVARADQLPAGCMLADNRVDLAVHLHAADCVLVTISTCGVEAALIDKPVVKMRFVDPSYRIFDPAYVRLDAFAPYEEMGIAIPITRLEDLEQACTAALPHGSQHESLRAARRRMPPVGGAASRAADAIVDFAARRIRMNCLRGAA